MKLIAEISTRIEMRMRAMVRTLDGSNAGLRAVFHGPPIPYLRDILDRLTSDGGLELELKNGDPIVVPVLLPLYRLGQGQQNPKVGESGICDLAHLLALRNTPACPQYLALMPPTRQNILSLENAVVPFGLSPDGSGGSATVETWWVDEFVQSLVDSAVARHEWTSDVEREGARDLLKRAVFAADDADRHSPERAGAWAVISRVLSIVDRGVPFATQWSLACGFPPTGNARVAAAEQIGSLKQLADLVENEGYSSALVRLKQTASGKEKDAVDSCILHLRMACEVPLAFSSAASYHYGPCRGGELCDPPDWWSALTSGRILELLEDETPVTEALEIECLNALIPAGRGLPIIVSESVALEVRLPEIDSTPKELLVSRGERGRSGHREWKETIENSFHFHDTSVPVHNKPIRYQAATDRHKKAAVRVVALESWDIGIVISSRTASKLSLPKKSSSRSGVALECSITLAGEGRHYLDVFLARGLELGAVISGHDSSTIGAPPLVGSVAPPLDESGDAWGVELNATPECQYDLTIISTGGEERLLRLLIVSEEVETAGVQSEFERLVRLNRQRGKVSGALEVQLDRQTRTADLQSWMMDPASVRNSFYPLVLAPDCGDVWRAPSWESAEGTVLSKGRFLHDPRPVQSEMVPPEDFVAARESIAARVRGSDGHGMMEGAEFGSWMSDPDFAELVDSYVRTWERWLGESPELAAWTDLIMVTRLEGDQATLDQEPSAVIVSPLHPLRLAWHVQAQRALWEAWRAGHECPAASILDPDSIPDALPLPLRTAGGTIKRVIMLATDCSSDYWSVLWNGSKLGSLTDQTGVKPFDEEFGIMLGGVSRGFSVSQVHRALEDVASLLSAKPVLNVLISSTAGQSDACNEGIIEWARGKFVQTAEGKPPVRVGIKRLHVFDDRSDAARPIDAVIANLTDDSAGAVLWYSGTPTGSKPDLGVIAQLETSNASTDPSPLSSPLGTGALIRHRLRTQLQAGAGAFLGESRMGQAPPPSGEALADHVAAATTRLENLGEGQFAYTFAPSVQAIQTLLSPMGKGAEYVAVSSAAVDPACFLGGWIEGAYLWDYELPSYSHRPGDTNGYYLLSHVKESDSDSLRSLLSKLPGCEEMQLPAVQDILLEVARRGVPTVRGLSAGHSGAAGDLGLFLAGRLLQDEFRLSEPVNSLTQIYSHDADRHEVALVVPVDPFRGHLAELHTACATGPFLRPDLLVARLTVSDSQVKLKLTPVEVKFRADTLGSSDCTGALAQAASLSLLFERIRQHAEATGLTIWRLAFQHLLVSMLDFGFRVYSQRQAPQRIPSEWARLHSQTIAAILADTAVMEFDKTGRLVVFDASASSQHRDLDQDGISETIVISPSDAGKIAAGDPESLYGHLRRAVGDWSLSPTLARQAADNIERLAAVDRPSGRASSSEPLPDHDQKAIDPALEELTSSPQDPQLERDRGRASQLAWTDSTLKPVSMPSEAESKLRPDESVQPEEDANDEYGASSSPPPPSLAVATSPSKSSAHHVRDGAEGMRILVGRAIEGLEAEEKYLRPSMTELNHLNMGVVGDLGTGKTQLLKSIIWQLSRGAAANAGVRPRFLIFDYKRDYSSPEFVTAVGARVVSPYQLPLNPFDTRRAVGTPPWMPRFKFFADILDKIYSNVGPVQRTNLKEAVKSAYTSAIAFGRQPTIYDVYQNYQQLVGAKVDAPLSIMGDMVDMELFSRNPAEASAFDEFFDGVVVIALDELGQDDKTKNMVVAVMLNLFYEFMLRLPKRPYRGDPQLRTVDSYLLVDEADNIMQHQFGVLRSILLQGREFGVGVILASQYLKHFRSGATDYRDPLLSWFIHKVPNIVAQDLINLGLPRADAQTAAQIQQLANHECLFKTVGVPGVFVRGRAFFEIAGK